MLLSNVYKSDTFKSQVLANLTSDYSAAKIATAKAASLVRFLDLVQVSVAKSGSLIFLVDVGTAALPSQVPSATSAILPMDLRIVDHSHHHHQQPPFGLVSQPHPHSTPAPSTACPASSEPGNGPIIGKSSGSPC